MKGNRYKNLGDYIKIFGIDLSKYQGNVDFAKAKAGGKLSDTVNSLSSISNNYRNHECNQCHWR